MHHARLHLLDAAGMKLWRNAEVTSLIMLVVAFWNYVRGKITTDPNWKEMQKQSTHSNDLSNNLQRPSKQRQGPGRSDLEAFDLQPFHVPVRASCRYQKLDCQSQLGWLYLPKLGQRCPAWSEETKQNMKLKRIIWTSGTFYILESCRLWVVSKQLQTTVFNARKSLIHNRQLIIWNILSMFRHVQAISVGKHP